MARTRKVIGQVGVDSGQLMIVDPCYLKEWVTGFPDLNDDVPTSAMSYAAMCKRTIKEPYYGQILNFEGGPRAPENPMIDGNDFSVGLGMVFASGWGDGCYPVVAEITESGRIAKITITMMDDGDDE